MYHQGTLKKWIQYEDGGHEPVAEHENINLKRHDPDREWFVVDRPKDFRPESLAPEAFHPRHKEEEYMKSFMDPNQQKASSRTGERDSFPFGAPPKRDDVYVMDEIPKNHPPRLPDFSRRPPLDVVLCDGANCPENRTQGKPDEDPRSLSGHAAANLVTGVVRMLDNGFDPNKKPVPQSNPTVVHQPVPGSGGIWGDERFPRDAGVLHATGKNAAQEGKSGQTRQQPAQPWRKPGSLLSDPAYWLNNQDQHPAPAGKLKQAEQQSNAKNPLERIYNGAGQALDKGMEAAGKATGKAWDALRSKEVHDGVEFGARAAWEVTKDVGKIVGEDAAMASLGVGLPSGASIAVDKIYKLDSANNGLRSGYEQQAKDLARRIAQQKRNVYSPTEK
jgi:hypothetical protein